MRVKMVVQGIIFKKVGKLCQEFIMNLSFGIFFFIFKGLFVLDGVFILFGNVYDF